jgi:hypothetical protein
VAFDVDGAAPSPAVAAGIKGTHRRYRLCVSAPLPLGVGDVITGFRRLAPHSIEVRVETDPAAGGRAAAVGAAAGDQAASVMRVEGNNSSGGAQRADSSSGSMAEVQSSGQEGNTFWAGNEAVEETALFPPLSAPDASPASSRAAPVLPPQRQAQPQPLPERLPRQLPASAPAPAATAGDTRLTSLRLRPIDAAALAADDDAIHGAVHTALWEAERAARALGLSLAAADAVWAGVEAATEAAAEARRFLGMEYPRLRLACEGGNGELARAWMERAAARAGAAV